MQLINFGMICLMSLTLMACSRTNPEPIIQTITKTEKITVPLVGKPKPVQLNDVKIYVVTEDNYDEFVEEFYNKNGKTAWIAISVKDYENLSLNFAELRRYIEQQKEVIIYYENAVQPLPGDASDSQ